jgi:hypothetical protein
MGLIRVTDHNDNGQEVEMENAEMDQFKQGLEGLAALIEANPEIPISPYRGIITLNVWIDANYSLEDEAERAADQRRRMTKLAREIGGRFEKQESAGHFVLRKSLDAEGFVRLDLNAPRSAICEQVVVGTTTEKRVEIPEDKLGEAEDLKQRLAALQVEREVEIEQTEWRCPPSLLAVAGGDAE